MKYLCYIILFYTSLLIGSNNYDNIYDIRSSPRNIAIGNIHSSTNDIISLFDSPIHNINNNKFFSLSVNNYNNLIDVYHFAYLLFEKNDVNLSIGLVRREIDNNFNTQKADMDNGYPNLFDIDYSKITSFYDKQTGLLFSYNRKMSPNLVLGINFKPEFHKILDKSAYGFGMDLRYLFLLNKYNVIIAIDNLFSTKKWETGLRENYNLNSYISITTKALKKVSIFSEYDFDKMLRIGLELKIIEMMMLRFGADDSNFSFGFGFKLKNFNIDYAYIDNKYDIFGNNHCIGLSLNLKEFH